MPYHPDILPSLNEPADAGQRALHGLLCTHFEPPVESGRRVEAILAAVRAIPQPDKSAVGPTADPAVAPRPRFVRFRAALRSAPRRWAIGGSLAAAAVLLPVLVVTNSLPQSASAQTIPLEHACAPSQWDSPPGLSGIDAEERFRAFGDPIGALGFFEAARNDAMTELDRQPADGSEQKAISPVMQNWAFLYRGLRDLGRFDEAVAEIEKAKGYWLDHCLPEESRQTNWYWVCYCDLGDVYATMADYPAAREAYEVSIDARKTYLAQLANRAVSLPPAPSTLAPLYWRMSDVAHSEGDSAAARAWHDRAHELFRSHWLGVCAAAGVKLSPDTSLLEAYRRAPDEFRNPPPENLDQDDEVIARAKYDGFVPAIGDVTWLRGQLYRDARMLCDEGDLDGAAAMLEQARRLPYSARHDESRLMFFEPLEAARIELARRHFSAALGRLDEAEQHAGPIPLTDPHGVDVSQPAVGPLVRAELELLRGMALRGMDPASAEGRELIDSALAAPRRLAEQMAPDDAQAFLKQFESWRRMTDRRQDGQ